MFVEVDELLLLVDDDATSVAPSPPAADSSCLLVRMIVMFITTSGDGVIGTSEYNVNSYDEVWIVDTNAEHEYLFIMERSDNDGEGASATEPNRRTEGEYDYRGEAEIAVNDDD